MMKKIILISFCFLFMIVGPDRSNAQSVYNASTEVQLVSVVKSIRPGSPFWIALSMKMDDHWHVYWRNPGDAGLAPSIEWDVPEGLSIGEMQWPYPQRIDIGGLTNYGYEGHIFLPMEIVPSATLDGTERTLQAHVRWLACEKICVPGEANLKLTLPVLETLPEKNTLWTNRFGQNLHRLPLKTDAWDVRAFEVDGQLEIIFVRKDAKKYLLKEVSFFPYSKDLINHNATQKLSSLGNGYKLTIPKSSLADELSQVQGILVADTGWLRAQSKKSLEVDVAVRKNHNELQPMLFEKPEQESPNKVVSVKAGEVRTSLTLWAACLFAFIGGLILNLMPCVLPVLSIKVLSLVAHTDDPKKAAHNGMVFTLGVLVSFWILAGLLIALKNSGQLIGWGFQFQSPVFVGLMALLFYALALNLFGLFEIGTSLTAADGKIQDRSTTSGAFFSGVLATIVATPCTAPFMGAALGFALTQSAGTAMAVFTFLGLGMAFPYLLLSRFPTLQKFLPEPGPWMITLKKVFGVLLLVVVAWLAWVLWQQRGVHAVTMLGVSFIIGGLALWMWGRTALAPIKQRIVPVLLIAVAIGVAVVGAKMKSEEPVKIESTSGIEWLPYSAELVEQLRRTNRPVFLDFTAAWCLSCQVNERVALNDQRVIQKFRDTGIVAVKADWTNYDQNITKALEALGKNSIPVYVVYPRDGKEEFQLPEILTPKIVLEALDKI